MSLATVGLQATSFFFNVAEKYAAKEGSTAISQVFQGAGLSADAIVDFIEENPVQAAGIFIAGMVTVAVIGPEVAAAGGVTALSESLVGFAAEFLGVAIPTAQADAVAAAAIDGALQFSGSSLYVGVNAVIQNISDAMNIAPSQSQIIISAFVTSTSVEQLQSTLASSGYYLSQPGDTASSVAAQLGLTPTLLQNINTPFADSDFASGGLLRVPTSSMDPTGGLLTIPPLQSGQTGVFDPITGKVYTVGASLDGSTNGSLIVNNQNGLAPQTLAPGTFSSLSFDPISGQVQVGILGANGASIGTLTHDTATGEDAFNLSVNPGNHDGDLTVRAGDGGFAFLEQWLHAGIAGGVSGAPYSQVVVHGILGGSSSEFNATEKEIFYSASDETPSGMIAQGVDSVIVEFTKDAQGQTLPQPVDHTLTAHNTFISNNADISGDFISNMQTLQMVGSVKLTASQFNSFQEIKGAGTIVGASGGSYSFAGKNLNGLGGNLTLDLSHVGGDVTLVAGSGNNVLHGGTGNDTLDVILAGTGSTIAGGAGNDTLVAGTDITQLSIATDVETLQVGSSVKLKAAQLSNFSTITGTPSSTSTVFVSSNTSGGTYSLAGKTLNGSIVLDSSLVTGNSTLVAAASGSTLKSGSGNDTLTGGAGNDTLIAGSGNDTMTGNGGDNTYVFTDALSSSTYLVNNFHTDSGQSTIQLAEGVTADEVTPTRSGDDLVLTISDDPIVIQNYFLSDAYKVASVNFADGTVWTAAHINELAKTVITGGDEDGVVLVGGPTGNYSMTAGNGNGDELSVNSDSNNILTVGNGNNNQLVVNGNGNNVLTVGSGSNSQLTVNGSGNNTLTGGNGGNTFVITGANNSVDVLTGGSGSDIFNMDGTFANGSSIEGGGGNDTLQAFNDITGLGISNVETLQTQNLTLSADQLAGFDNVELAAGVSSGTLAAISGGTYSLAGKTTDRFDIFATSNEDTTLVGNDADGEVLIVNGNGNNVITAGNGDDGQLIVNGNGNNSLMAGDGAGNQLTVNGSGNNTLTGGNGGTTLSITGADNSLDVLTGGSGDDAFSVLGTLASGSSITGGGGNDVLSAFGDLSSVDITDIQTLNNGAVTLTATQFANNFTALTGFGSITASGAGTYSLVGKDVSGFYSLNGGTSNGVTLVANDAGSALSAGSGNDTLIGGAGDDFLYAFSAGAGSAISGGGGNDTLITGDDISQLSIGSDVETLDLSFTESVKLTADQLANFSTIFGPLIFDPTTGTFLSGTGILYATTAGTYSLAGKTLDGDIVLDTSLVTGDSTLVATDGGSTLKAGSGNDTLTGGAGDDTLVAGSGNDTMTGNGGDNAYVFTDALSTSTYLVNNFHTDSGQSTIQLAEGVTPEEVTATRSGDDLVLTISDDPIVIQNYFLGDGYKIASVNFADSTVWTAAHLEELVAAGSVTFVNGGDDDNVKLYYPGITSNYNITVGNGDFDAIGIDHSTSNNILTAGNGDYDWLSAQFSSGDNTLTAGHGLNAALVVDDSTGNNTLTAGDSYNAVLRAERSTGNNSLTAGTNLYDTLSVHGSSGNNTLTVGNGDFAVMVAESTAGDNTLTAGDGDSAFLSAQSSTGDNTLIAGNGQNVELKVNDSTGNNTLTVGDGDHATLKADGSSGNNTLTAGDGDHLTLAASDSQGDNVLTAGDGSFSNMLVENSWGDNTLTIGDGTDNFLSVKGSHGNNILTAGEGHDENFNAQNSEGSNTLTAGNGTNNTFNIDGSHGDNILTVGNGLHDTFSANDSTGNNTFTIGDGNNATMFVENSSGNNTLTTGNGSGNFLSVNGSSGNNTVVAGSGDNLHLSADNSTGHNTLTVADGIYNTLSAQSSLGNNTLTAGDGGRATLHADHSTGDNMLTAGEGDHALLTANYSAGHNVLTAGSNGGNELHVDNSTGDNTLTIGDSIYATLSAQDSQGNNTLTAGDGGRATLNVNGSSGDNILTVGNGDHDTLTALNSSGNNTLTAGDEWGHILDVSGSTGSNTLTVGNGYYNTLTGGNGDDTLTVGTGGNNTLNGGGGNDTYTFGSAFGQDTINNVGSDNTNTAKGEIDFGAGISDENLWFKQSGNNLEIDLLGTGSKVTVSDWFSDTDAQVVGVHAGGLVLDSQVSQLIQAMATFSANNAGFDPSSALAMPTDSGLQTTIAASWH
jgi:Ca2+-binding RTX toxin-like protein